jgi:cytochrome P450
MSAASFGGSFNLVESDDTKQKDLFNSYLKRVAIDAQFPFVKYLPGIPSASSMVADLIDRIVSKRREEMEKGIVKKDLLQIFVETNNADPVSFSEKHIHAEMLLFMSVTQSRTSSNAQILTGLREVIQRVSLLRSLYFCFSTIKINSKS